jgi:hypothetical protein
MSWKTITHTLTHPINCAGKTYDRITLREPDVDALEAIEELGLEEGAKMGIKQLRGVIVALCDLDDAAIGKMHRTDLMAMGELIAPLLSGSESDEAPSSN